MLLQKCMSLKDDPGNSREVEEDQPHLLYCYYYAITNILYCYFYTIINK